MAVMARSTSVLLLSLAFLARVAFATEGGVHIDVQHLPQSCETKAQTGDYVSVHYVGKLTDGSEFDNSYSSGNPIEFQLGAQQVIAGWDQGIQGMCVGEKRRLQIPPHLAYGEEGIGPIPGGATLVFDVELMRVSEEPPATDQEGYASYDVYNGFGGEPYPEEPLGEDDLTTLEEIAADEEGPSEWEQE